MKQFLVWLAFVAFIMSMPFMIDRVVDCKIAPEGPSAAEQKALSDLVVRSSREAEAYHAKQGKPSLSQQAMIVRDLYGN